MQLPLQSAKHPSQDALEMMVCPFSFGLKLWLWRAGLLARDARPAHPSRASRGHLAYKTTWMWTASQIQFPKPLLLVPLLAFWPLVRYCFACHLVPQ